MWPMPRAPISSTRCRVSSSARSAVSGSPISLLSEPGVHTVGAEPLQQLGDQVLGAGLAGGAGERDDGRRRGAR